ncbi:MAG: SBBP repeat-containing protein [Acidobacteria bacterium]|nr:SBBP repeat-containing protein [Acidobacteriota bacterium]
MGANPSAAVTGLDELPGKSNYFIGNDPKKWRTNVRNYAKVKYQSVYPGIDLVYYGNQGQLEYDFVVAPGANPNAIKFQIETQTAPSRPAERDATPLLSEERTKGWADPGLATPLLGKEGDSGWSNPKPAIGRIEATGDLVISTEAGDVRFRKPVVYQPVAPPFRAAPVAAMSPSPGGGETPLQPNPKSKIENPKLPDARFVLLAENRVGFELGSYDKSRPLVIDPVLIYSTYLGGTDSEYPAGIAADSSGDAYVTGQTYSTDFPTQNPLQGNSAVGVESFVTKLSASGDALVYSTYLGGSGNDSASAITVDAAGNAYLTGGTDSPDFPIVNAIQATISGGADVFVAKLNAAGNALVYSTFLGGSPDNFHNGNDYGSGIAIDSSGNVYVVGPTTSANFPTLNPIQANHGGGTADAFVTKVNDAGSALVYSTYLGGTQDDYALGIVVDTTGGASVTGYTNSTNFPAVNPIQSPYGGGDNDAFVAKLNAAGSALVYSTYLGGADNDVSAGIALDSTGNAYVTGYTSSADFPTQNPLQGNYAGDTDGFVTKLSAAGDVLLYSTYLGGTLNEYFSGIAVDNAGNAYISGRTSSRDFPTVNPIQAAQAPGYYDAFVATLNNSGSGLIQSTYYGGSSDEVSPRIAVDGSGYAYITGVTFSSDFPILNPLQPALVGINGDAFVTKLSLVPVPGMSLSPSNLDFGGQLVGAISTAQTITITNTGDLRLTVSSIAAAGDFDVPAVSFPCSSGGPLDPGLSCGMSVTFNPTATGTSTGTLTIVSNAPASPYNARLSGTGTDFDVVAQPGETTSATVNAGGTATFNLQLVPTGFSGTVELACAFQDSKPRGASCSVSPASVRLDGTNPAPLKVSLGTTARSLGAPQFGAHRAPLQPSPWAQHAVLLLVGLMLAAVAAGSRRRSPALQRATLGAILLLALLWASCGGGGGGTPGTGTPAGTYSLTLTASAGGVAKTSTLTLKVN